MRYVCGLDIGSSKIAGCLGIFKNGRLDNLFWDSLPVSAIKRGQCQDFTGLTNSLTQLLKNLKVKSGVKIKSVYLAITSQNISVKHSQAIIALAERGNRAVSKRDIQNVNQQARILGSSLEEEIIYTEPQGYTIDEESKVINPLGLYGHQLKVDLYLILTKVSYINTIIEVINRLGLHLNDINLSGLAVGQAVFGPDRKTGLDILCDIGKDITQILIFNEARLSHYQTIAYGGDNLTDSLIQKLKVPYPLAEEIKISHGRVQNNLDTQDREIIIKKDTGYTTLSQNKVIDILSHSSMDIAEAIRDIIKSQILLISSPILPREPNVYICGRSACLEGFLEILEVVMGMPVKMARLSNSGLLTPLLRRRIFSGEPILNYLVCLGLIANAINFPHKKEYSHYSLRNLLPYFAEKAKQIYHEYF